jgi:hypothetical protein
MKTFLRRFGDQIIGVLHGFDRLRFRGSKRTLCYPAGLLGSSSRTSAFFAQITGS